MFVLDGAKALHKAVGDVFGESAVIARCRTHKERNVMDHLNHDAVAILREGLGETLTVTRLGVTGSLFKTVMGTNPMNR